MYRLPDLILGIDHRGCSQLYGVFTADYGQRLIIDVKIGDAEITLKLL